MPVPSPVTVRVPAKVNLHLGVGPRRPDGYHDLQTVFQALSIYDEVTAYPAPGLTVMVKGQDADEVPVDSTNLALRAAALLAERTGVDAAARIGIRKEIPVAGGMAGGSADAAAALVACDALWGTGLSRAQLAELAAELGSDVPFCLQGGCALGTGRGQVLTPVLARGSFHWVVAIAATGLSTPEVYAEIDRRRGPGAEATPPDEVLAALRLGDAKRLGAALHNDLEPAAIGLRPALRATLDAGRELGALGAMVSGSGPTCVFLARSHAAAIRIAAALTAEAVCKTTRVAEGPVPGPRVG
ncbi:MAG: 4-diphosphocytidyl-2-C-methyl-D-erythritol kinase [Frankiaceae bacterium]|nr:4-diphosphocytidyl-2-C-methyl-D-erythritol kinase [Frankiaceae bacterium]MDX6224203.1 4-diphosphocytidyl-2-C-methyl-D-erythritol kinase [Frankiales bacterium]MDX6273705.1 4-diphosphocytidyl-2-C-methyl-D-erythritol kinase [Frankiales bacterium]